MSAVGKHSQPYPWEQRKLGETFLFKKNNTFSRSELSFENGYVKNIHYGDILVKYNEYLNVHNNSNIPFVTQNIPSNFSSSYLQVGDIVMADTAEDETVGKSTEISSLSSNDRVLAGLHTIPLSPKQKFGSGFLGFYLNSNSYHDKLRPLMQGIKVTSISKKNLKNTILQFPKELEEQKRIGKLFIKLNRTITLHEEQHRRLEQLKKALLQKMFADETGYPALRFKGFTENWKQSYLKDIASVNSGRDYKHLNKGNIPVYGTGGYMLSVDKALSNTKDGIGIGRKGTINNPYILRAPFWTVDTLFYVIPYNIDLNFLYGIFQKIDWRKKDESTGVPSLSKENINKTKFKIPAISEQKKIGIIFQNLDSLITLHQHKIHNLKRLKRALLQKMFV